MTKDNKKSGFRLSSNDIRNIAIMGYCYKKHKNKQNEKSIRKNDNRDKEIFSPGEEILLPTEEIFSPGEEILSPGEEIWGTSSKISNKGEQKETDSRKKNNTNEHNDKNIARTSDEESKKLSMKLQQEWNRELEEMLEEEQEETNNENAFKNLITKIKRIFNLKSEKVLLLKGKTEEKPKKKSWELEPERKKEIQMKCDEISRNHKEEKIKTTNIQRSV